MRQTKRTAPLMPKSPSADAVGNCSKADAPSELLDYRKLRKLPALDDVFGKELTSGMAVFNRGRKKVPGARPFGSELPVDPAITEIIEQWWPEIFDSTHGGCVTVELEAGEKLEKLCDMFGVPLKLKAHSAAVFGHAYDIFVQSFGWDIKNELSKPGYTRKIKVYWEPEWVDYIEAVAYQRREDVRRLARKLGVLRSGATYPAKTIAGSFEAPPEMNSVLDTLWAIEDAMAN